jgi:two-component system, NarL family, nitrate/nitrite response regulator NarL
MRVLIADDHPLYREAAALQVRRLYPDAKVEEVSSLPELRQTTADGSGPYDLILLDYHMPGMSHDALVQLVDEFTATALAVISGTSANADIRAAVQAGLRGFIPKTSSPEHFALALQILLAGGSSVPAEILLDRPAANNFAAEPWLAKMTEREREVLKGVIQGRSNKEIARQVELAEVTVKLHLRNVFRKMDVKSRAEAAVKAVKAGFG